MDENALQRSAAGAGGELLPEDPVERERRAIEAAIAGEREASREELRQFSETARTEEASRELARDVALITGSLSPPPSRLLFSFLFFSSLLLFSPSLHLPQHLRSRQSSCILAPRSMYEVQCVICNVRVYCTSSGGEEHASAVARAEPPPARARARTHAVPQQRPARLPRLPDRSAPPRRALLPAARHRHAAVRDRARLRAHRTRHRPPLGALRPLDASQRARPRRAHLPTLLDDTYYILLIFVLVYVSSFIC